MSSKTNGFSASRPVPVRNAGGNNTGAGSCTEDEYSSEFDENEFAGSPPSAVALVGSFRRPSFTFGGFRPTVVPSSPLSTAAPYLTQPERDQMVTEEQDLLRDNRLISEGYGREAAKDRRSSLPSGESSLQEIFGRVVSNGGDEDERTALLGGDPAAKWDEAIAAGMVQTTPRREAKVLLTYSAPLVVTFLLQYSLVIASVFSAGNLGKDELAAVSLASMTANITGYAVYQGLSTALDTLCAQAYGSGKKKMVGLHFQRMAIFLMVISVPITSVWFCSEWILMKLIPEKELARLAGDYMRVLALGAPGYALFECGKRFVQAQGIFSAATWVLLVCSPLNALMNYLLVWHPTIGIGFIGAPVAVVITNWLMPLLLFLYVRFVNGSQCWGGFSSRALRNWGPMVKLAIPGLVMVLAEFLAFEVLTLLASYFGTTHLAAQSVLATACSVTFQIPFALSIATSTRVANFLGATLGDAAKTTAHVGFIMAGCVGLCNSLVVFLARKQYARLFTADEDVIALIVEIMPIAAAFQFVDGISCIGAGVLRGQGRQYIGSYLNLVTYYVIAMPFSIVTAFVFDWKLTGLWSGVAIALFLNAAIETTIIRRTNWAKVVEDTKARVSGA
ncbi:ethionine resistance protein [Rhizina undulata]